MKNESKKRVDALLQELRDKIERFRFFTRVE